MKFFISNSRLVVFISLALSVMGIYGILNLKRESIPPVDFARAIITTVYPGSSSMEAEELISSKIEEEIRSVNHLKDVHSESRPGLSQIRIRIDIDEGDSSKIIHELGQSLQNVRGLPPDVLDPPRLVHLDSGKRRPIMNLYVTGPDNQRLRDQIGFRLKNRLEKLKGVSEIRMTNYKKRELSVLLSQEKMDKYYISSADVISALEKTKIDVPAGHLESPKERYLARALGKPRAAEDIENIIIRSNFSGKKIWIKDVARVIDGPEKEISKQYFYQSKKGAPDNLSPSLSLEILKSASAGALTLISEIQKSLNSFKKSLNSEYQIFIGFNEGDNIKRRLASAINNGLTGLVLIFIALFLFLPFRTGLMAGLSLPLSVFGAFAVLPFMGVSFNVITMLAFVICVGMLIDNSVVVSEYYSRLVTEGKESPSSAAILAVRQFKKPITATALTTIAAFLPMLATTGVMGQFIRWIPIVVTLALLMSLFESFCLLPSRLKWLGPKKISPYKQRLLTGMNRLEDYFEKALRKIAGKKYISLSGIALLILASAALFKFGSQVDLFAPKSPEFYTALIEPKNNSSLALVDKEARRIARAARKAMGGEKVIERMAVQASAEKGEILIRVKPSVLRRLKYKDILQKLRAIDKGDLKSLTFNILKGGPPVGKALNIAIQSSNRGDIQKFIDEIFPEINKIPGLVNLKINPERSIGAEYKIHIQKETLAKLGLGFQSVGLAVRTALEGHIVTELSENSESFYIRVKHDPEKMSSLESLRKIKIRERFGRLIPLSELAEIKKAPLEPHKKSYNFSPAVFLEANIDPKKTTSMEANIKAQKIIDEKIKNRPALSFKMIGEQETTNESLRSLFRSAILAFFAIFVILIVLFKSFLLSFLILTCVPLGLIGAVWAFFIHQRPLDFFAFIGVVGLAGVVVNSAIILVSFILKLREEEPESPLFEIAIRASKIRLRPIVITNLTTLGGFLPTAYGIAGFEPLLQPMTLALFWGLLTATFLTLIWVPCAMLMIEDGEKLFASLKKKLF